MIRRSFREVPPSAASVIIRTLLIVLPIFTALLLLMKFRQPDPSPKVPDTRAASRPSPRVTAEHHEPLSPSDALPINGEGSNQLPSALLLTRALVDELAWELPKVDPTQLRASELFAPPLHAALSFGKHIGRPPPVLSCTFAAPPLPAGV